jgi:hypothetical protein
MRIAGTALRSLKARLARLEAKVPPPAHSPSANMTTGELRSSIIGVLGIDEGTLADVGPQLQLMIVSELARRDREGIRR